MGQGELSKYYLYMMLLITEISLVHESIISLIHSHESVLPVLLCAWCSKSGFLVTLSESLFVFEIALIVFLEMQSMPSYLSSIFVPSKPFTECQCLFKLMGKRYNFDK